MINDTNLRYVICTVCDGSGEVVDTEEAVDDEDADDELEDDGVPVADREWEAAQGNRDDSLFDDVDDMDDMDDEDEDDVGADLDIDDLDEDEEDGN